MRRRDLIALLSSAMAQWPFAASAQKGDQLRQIGILAAAPFKPFDSFRQRLRERSVQMNGQQPQRVLA